MGVRMVKTKWDEELRERVTVSDTVEYEGCVLSVYNRSVRVMSDVWELVRYAKVWDAERGDVVEVCAANGATEDATEETLAAVLAWKNAMAEDATKKRFEAERAESRKAAEDPFVKGRKVRVVARRGRGVPEKGTVGTVFWTGYSRGYGTPRVGFKETPEGEALWSAASNLEAVEPDYGCETCNGVGWEPANDGKGGTTECRTCTAEAEVDLSEVERASYLDRLTALATELADSGYSDASNLVLEATDVIINREAA